MMVLPIKLRLLHPPKDDLFEAIRAAAFSVRERDVIAISSKVIALAQGRCVPYEDVTDKDDLIRREAEWYLSRNEVPGEYVLFTRKHGSVIPSAGIDESNANGHYILWPEHIEETAAEVLTWFRKQFGVRELGILITDSRSVPFRRGIVGFALGWAGFNPLYDYRGQKDLFGRELLVSQTNVADSLAAAAVLSMGEGKEQTPLALLRDIPNIQFGTAAPAGEQPFSSFVVPMKEDMYAPFYSRVPWKKGGSSDRD